MLQQAAIDRCQSIPKHSILILDGSGSMNSSYSDLIGAVNNYITEQTKRNGIISVVAFSSSATVIRTLSNKTLSSMEGYDGGSTNFAAALNAAIPLIRSTPNGYSCCILFFTDGLPDCKPYQEYLDIIQSENVTLNAIGFGSADRKVLDDLCQNGGKVSIGMTMADIAEIYREYAFS